jgi:DNA-binding FadR family transcriptional regulator
VVAFARTKLSDHLLLHVCREIVRGDLTPGDQLGSEHELSAQFGISKPVIRESLRALASLGMIHVQQGKRTVVLPSTEWNVLDPLLQEAFELEGRGGELARQLYELRLILETASAARAAARATPAQVEDLRRLSAQLAEIAVTTRDLDEFLLVDRAFHAAVAQASSNEVLRQVIRNVHDFLTRAWSTQSISEEELELLADLHVAIAEAIATGDEAGASAAMARHLERALAKELGRSPREVGR